MCTSFVFPQVVLNWETIRVHAYSKNKGIENEQEKEKSDPERERENHSAHNKLVCSKREKLRSMYTYKLQVRTSRRISDTIEKEEKWK